MTERKPTQPPAPPAAVQIQIELDPDTAQGMYVNMAMVNHTEGEFTLDFIYVQPQAPKGKVRARIISSPKHAKRLLLALQDSINQFEQKFGPIDISGPPAPPSQILN
jgi:hypothetical protein